MADEPKPRLISKQAMVFHGLTVGAIRSYSDGSATCKLKKDQPLVQAMFNTLVEEVSKAGFVQDPEHAHMFHYQMPVEETANNDEESADGTD